MQTSRAKYHSFERCGKQKAWICFSRERRAETKRVSRQTQPSALPCWQVIKALLNWFLFPWKFFTWQKTPDVGTSNESGLLNDFLYFFILFLFLILSFSLFLIPWSSCWNVDDNDTVERKLFPRFRSQTRRFNDETRSEGLFLAALLSLAWDFNFNRGGHGLFSDPTGCFPPRRFSILTCLDIVVAPPRNNCRERPGHRWMSSQSSGTCCKNQSFDIFPVRFQLSKGSGERIIVNHWLTAISFLSSLIRLKHTIGI